jgi:hypothetical protein
VLSIGRRWERVHQRLLQRCQAAGFFYLHDTASLSEIDLYDCREHRNAFANIAKRSRYFLVAPGKVDVQGETGGQVEIGYRYFEGCAAGTVMLGQAPDVPVFRELFDWPDVVVPIKDDGSDVLDVVRVLDLEPERIRAISRRNATESLLRHDWIHRWRHIFKVADLPLGRGMAARIARLQELATLAGADVPTRKRRRCRDCEGKVTDE